MEKLRRWEVKEEEGDEREEATAMVALLCPLDSWETRKEERNGGKEGIVCLEEGERL